MESRLERYKRKKQQKKSKRKKIVVLILLFLLLFVSIYLVDNSFRQLMCIKDTRVFAYNYNSDKEIHQFHFFGSNYFIEQKRIDEGKRKIEEEFRQLENKTKKYIDRVIDYLNN